MKCDLYLRLEPLETIHTVDFLLWDSLRSVTTCASDPSLPKKTTTSKGVQTIFVTIYFVDFNLGDKLTLKIFK